MWTVRVKDRGRDLIYHRVDRRDEADELAAVYAALGYADDRITVERADADGARAA